MIKLKLTVYQFQFFTNHLKEITIFYMYYKISDMIDKNVWKQIHVTFMRNIFITVCK